MITKNILSILFTKDGFSFCIFKNDEKKIYDQFSLDISSGDSIDDLVFEQMKDNLYWKQDFDNVKVILLNEQFNIIPNEYLKKNSSIEEWIAFNTNIYEGDTLEAVPLDNYDATFLYSYSYEIKNILKTYFKSYDIKPSGALLLNSIKSESEEFEFFINLNLSYLEILCINKNKLKFYNHFKVETKEDILYYILNAYKELGLDPNKNNLYYFGEIQQKENLLKMLLNFVRHVIPGINQKGKLELFTHYKNCL